MNGSEITLHGELLAVSPEGITLRTRGGQVIEVPAAAVLNATTGEGKASVELVASARLIIRVPEERDHLVSSDVFDRVILDDEGGGGGGDGGNCNCNCSGGNCNCNCNCSSASITDAVVLPRLRRQLF